MKKTRFTVGDFYEILRQESLLRFINQLQASNWSEARSKFHNLQNKTILLMQLKFFGGQCPRPPRYLGL